MFIRMALVVKGLILGDFWTHKFPLMSLPATWRSMIRTAVCRWRCGTGTWPAATTLWDRCPLAFQSFRNKGWMAGKRNLNKWSREWKDLSWRPRRSRKESKGDLVHYCSLGAQTLFGAPLPNLVIFSARAALPPSFYLCFFISPPPSLTLLLPSLCVCSPITISLNLPLFFLLTLLCQGF